MAPLKDNDMIDCRPHKAQYRPGEEVEILIRITGENISFQEDASFQVRIYRLYQPVREITCCLSGNEKEALSENTFLIRAPLGVFTETFSGFGVEVQSNTNGIKSYTSFDVVEKSREVLRYGFLSDFSTSDREDTADLDALLACHVNIVQFYDWAYRHHHFLPPERVYTDMMGKALDFSTIQAKIAGCHERGMRALGYGAVYAAAGEYHALHPEEGLYTSAGDPYIFIDRFYIMNVAAGPWRARIIGEYRKALEQAGFDGIHMDTYGFPKTAFNAGGRRICLENEYPGLISDTRAALDPVNPEALLIFNNVGNWPVGDTARSPQNAVYIEVWPPYTGYDHLRRIILDAQAACGWSKTVIIAAYIAPFRTETEDRALVSSLLLFGTIVSHGATHLFLGEDNAVLTQGYYSDYTRLSGKAVKRLREYHDFAVRYSALFYDPLLRDVSLTHCGGDNREYCCHSRDWSVSPEAGKRWLVIREGDTAKLLSILNLSGNSDINWNAGKAEPENNEGLFFTVQVDFPVKGIWQASPEQEGGGMSALSWTEYTNDRGCCVDFTVPHTGIWTLIYIELDGFKNIGESCIKS